MSADDAKPAPGLERIRSRLEERAAQIAGQSSVFLGTLVASKVVIFLFTIFLARTLGAGPLGLFALGLSIATLLATLALYGLPEAALRFVPLYGSREEPDRARNLLSRSAKLVAGGAAAGGLALALFRDVLARDVFGEPELAAYLPAFGLVVLALALYRLARHQLRGLQEAGREATLNLTVHVGGRVVLSVALIALGFGLWGYVAGYLAALVLAGVVVYRAVWRRLGSGAGWAGREPLGSEVHDFARYALGAGLVAVAIERGDRVLLGLFLEAGDIGVYDVAMSVAMSLTVALTAANAILGPVISELHDRGEAELLDVLAERSNKWVTAFTLPGAVALCVYAPEVMGLFGERFAAGWPVLALLVGAQAVNVGMGSTGALVSMSGHQRRHFWSMVLAAGALVALDLVLIPLWGGPGAAGAFLIAVTLQYLYLWWSVVDLLDVNPLGAGFRPVLLPLAGGAACIAGLRVVTYGHLGAWWVSFGVAALGGYAVSLALVARAGTDEVDRVLLAGARRAARGLGATGGRNEAGGRGDG